MIKVLVTYYSQKGDTEKMAALIASGASEASAEVTLRAVDEIRAADLLKYDAIIVGSPTYYGSMAYQIKRLFDESFKFHGKLKGKVGAAFTSSVNIGGGNETTILEILHVFLVHGMIIQGFSKGDHYGPVSIGSPDERVAMQCRLLGEQVVRLAQILQAGKESIPRFD